MVTPLYNVIVEGNYVNNLIIIIELINFFNVHFCCNQG